MNLLRPAGLALFSVVALATPSPGARAQKEPPPACVTSRGEARARAVGYDHVVTIENRCTRPAACVVSTDVAPELLHVTVPSKDRAELTTFRGSSSSVFTARVECKLQ